MPHPKPCLILGKVSDKNHPALRADEKTNSFVTMDFSRNQMHSGKHFFSKSVVDVTDADTIVRLMFVTPNTDTRVHAKAMVSGESEFLVEIYEGISVTSNGTSITTFNNDRDSTTTPELATFAEPTVSSEGTKIWASRIGSGKDAGVSARFGYEIIAKTNTKYMFKITKAAAGTHYLDTDFWWSEHDPNDM